MRGRFAVPAPMCTKCGPARVLGGVWRQDRGVDMGDRSISVYTTGAESGGGMIATDSIFVYFMNLLAELVIDPDVFGDRALRIGSWASGEGVIPLTTPAS
jgi:hypothetical protein